MNPKQIECKIFLDGVSIDYITEMKNYDCQLLFEVLRGHFVDGRQCIITRNIELSDKVDP
jgi:hypothetical protein